MTIFALHGFLGLPSDFEKVQKYFEGLEPQVDWFSVDYLRRRELSAENTLSTWGENFNQFVQSLTLAPASSLPQRWLVGYSQGGRLALHALQQNPQMWKGAILLSTALGLPELERKDRQISDQKWATDFLNDPFDQTVARWNAQAVFKGSTAPVPLRKENDFNRRQLVNCLTNWSVAQHPSFLPFLKSTPLKIRYLAGENDRKYIEMGRVLERQAPKISTMRIPNAGHRLIFDQPEEVANQIQKLLLS